MSSDKQSRDDSAQGEQPWGRVAEDGTVYVRTADGERSVGSYEAGTAEEALEFFTKRFEELEGKVHLLEQRVASGRLAPEEATSSVKALREQVVDAHAVGDLVSLAARLDALAPVIAVQRSARKEERAQKSAESKAAKEKLVAEAERLADSTDWRNGANRLRELLATWKELPRLDRATDDALWRRFSTARTTYTRHRKAHFAEEHERRDCARVVKERLAKEAEALVVLDRVGPDRRQVPRPDARVEGRRPRAARGRRPALAALPRRPGHLLRRPRRGQRRARRGVRRQRRGQGRRSSSRPRRWSRSPTSRPPRRPSATSPTAGTPPARSPATG